MPIYEYICKTCNFSIEKLEKINDIHENTCPHCKIKLKKIISKSNFDLKGKGWYKTDYKENNNTK